MIPYDAIRLVKKESTLLIFPNAIRFVLQSREEVVFASFVSRDNCYSLILRQFANSGHSQAAIQSINDKSTVKSRAQDAKKEGKAASETKILGAASLIQIKEADTALQHHDGKKASSSLNEKIPRPKIAQCTNSEIEPRPQSHPMDLNESIITIGEDYIEISRVGDDVVQSGFDPNLDRSVVEIDYSDQEYAEEEETK